MQKSNILSGFKKAVKLVLPFVFILVIFSFILLTLPGVAKNLDSSLTKFHRDEALQKPATIKNAKKVLIRTYTNDKQAFYVYRFTWPYRSKVEYAKVEYKSLKLDDSTHTLKYVGLKYYRDEPIPDNVKNYLIHNAENDYKLQQTVKKAVKDSNSGSWFPFVILTNSR